MGLSIRYILNLNYMIPLPSVTTTSTDFHFTSLYGDVLYTSIVHHSTSLLYVHTAFHGTILYGLTFVHCTSLYGPTDFHCASLQCILQGTNHRSTILLSTVLFWKDKISINFILFCFQCFLFLMISVIYSIIALYDFIEQNVSGLSDLF